jgi:hypothetical protein
MESSPCTTQQSRTLLIAASPESDMLKCCCGGRAPCFKLWRVGGGEWQLEYPPERAPRSRVAAPVSAQLPSHWLIVMRCSVCVCVCVVLHAAVSDKQHCIDFSLVVLLKVYVGSGPTSGSMSSDYFWMGPVTIVYPPTTLTKPTMTPLVSLRQPAHHLTHH